MKPRAGVLKYQLKHSLLHVKQHLSKSMEENWPKSYESFPGSSDLELQHMPSYKQASKRKQLLTQ